MDTGKGKVYIFISSEGKNLDMFKESWYRDMYFVEHTGCLPMPTIDKILDRVINKMEDKNMIEYTRKGNTVIAKFVSNYGFSDCVEWQQQLFHWMVKRFPALAAATIQDSIDKYVTRDRNYCGKAKCHPDDDFDMLIGMAIARERLLQKFKRDISRIRKDIVSKVFIDILESKNRIVKRW